MTAEPQSPVTLCIDLGKTNCRAVILGAAGRLHSVTLDGVAGAADGGGSATERILTSIGRLPADVVRSATACGIGAAGILSTPTAGGMIAEAVHHALGLPVAVASDVITAHLGAFAGGVGAILVAGTGAVAVGIDDAGALRRVDGWGPEIGDLGSGSWIGREGLRAVLGAEAGLGAVTSLTARLEATAPARDAMRSVLDSSNPAGQLAAFAPLVIDEAERGDVIARGIVDAAIELLGATAGAAAGGVLPVATLGGLTRHPWFGALLSERLRTDGLLVTAPLGDAIDGALIAAIRTDLPHERHVHRA